MPEPPLDGLRQTWWICANYIIIRSIIRSTCMCQTTWVFTLQYDYAPQKNIYMFSWMALGKHHHLYRFHIGSIRCLNGYDVTQLKSWSIISRFTSHKKKQLEAAKLKDTQCMTLRGMFFFWIRNKAPQKTAKPLKILCPAHSHNMVLKSLQAEKSENQKPNPTWALPVCFSVWIPVYTMWCDPHLREYLRKVSTSDVGHLMTFRLRFVLKKNIIYTPGPWQRVPNGF